jgi:26S proteasome regulatory subunit N11
MLLNLHKKEWSKGLTLEPFDDFEKQNESNCQSLLKLAKEYQKSIQEEQGMSDKEKETRWVGKLDPKRHLQDKVESMMQQNIGQCLGSMFDAVSF